VPRARFALMRFGAGAVLLAAPMVALWIGAIFAGAAAELPPGLRSYPHALAVRFMLATAMAYAVFSAISAGTPRTAGYVLAVIGLLVWLQVMLAVAGSDVRLLDMLFERLTIWPGAFEVFTGRWTLIDV